ncbi:hypothetical protein BUALT_Bualt16G0124800 [Buddleja alternifolia]|uniref:MYB-CC type transcription factor LHEQLE-containing domain-containing protein n=1 Tax=Buddleja alternifolia TaxID=168488 RepID=A0AAV6WJD3_9LAMI|nr:hypothetical protein BUALT_Bualt16G0124800 [Buddleja alternifolia]
MKRVQESTYEFSCSDFTSQIPDYIIPQNYEAQLFMSLSEYQNHFQQFKNFENSLFGDSSARTDPDIVFDSGIVRTPIPNSQCISFSESEQLLHLKNKPLGDLDHDSSTKIDSCPFDAYRDLDVPGNLYASHFALMDQFGAPPGCPPNTSGNNYGSPGSVSSSKTRIRWNQDLHDRFVECVNRLGGPDRRSEKKTNVAEFDFKTGMQLKEALQLQIDVQRHLHEQLEIQRNLQLRIEEQGKQLKMMLDQQQKSKENIRNSNKKCPNILSTTLEDTDEILVSEGSDDDLD